MNCPHCGYGSNQHRCYYTRSSQPAEVKRGATARFRQCENCGSKFKTIEVVDPMAWHYTDPEGHKVKNPDRIPNTHRWTEEAKARMVLNFKGRQGWGRRKKQQERERAKTRPPQRPLKGPLLPAEELDSGRPPATSHKATLNVDELEQLRVEEEPTAQLEPAHRAAIERCPDPAPVRDEPVKIQRPPKADELPVAPRSSDPAVSGIAAKLARVRDLLK